MSGFDYSAETPPSVGPEVRRDTVEDLHAKGPGEQGWPASMVLKVGEATEGVRLLERRHQGPLYVQKPFYPEGGRWPHVYILHPPGGIVSGDHLQVDVGIDAQCAALFTTPGAGRLYRARSGGRLQRQRISIDLADAACVEWLPGENIVYPGARARTEVRVALGKNSGFIGWDITSVGLPASGMPFDHGRVIQRFSLFRGERPVLIDTLHLDAAQSCPLDAGEGLMGRPVNAVFVAGPLPEPDRQPLVDRLRAVAAGGDALLGVTCIREFLVIRYLGRCAWQARQLLIRCWRLVRPVLFDRPACEPRIWMT